MIRIFPFLMLLTAACGHAFDMPKTEVTVELEHYGENGPLFWGSLFSNNLEWGDNGNGLLDDKGAWRESMLKVADSLQPPVLRFPGGTLASSYNWEKGIGPQKDRGMGTDFQGNLQPMRFGTDEYLSLLSRLNARGLIITNLKKDPAETAAWLRYIQENKGKYSPEPNVDLWEIGNESYISSDPSFTTANEYITDFEGQYKHLKAIDPSIKVGAILEANSFDLPWVKPLIPEYNTWNETVVRGLHKAGVPPDFYGLHFYALFDADPADSKNKQALLVAPAALEKKIQTLRKTLEAHNDTAQLYVTEFGIVMKEPMSTWKYNLDPVQGVYITDMLMMFARNGIEISCFWSMFNNYCFGAYGNDSDYLYALGRLTARPPDEYRPVGKVYLTLRPYRDLKMLQTNIKTDEIPFTPVGNVTSSDKALFANAVGLLTEEGPIVLAVNRSIKDTIYLDSTLSGTKLTPRSVTQVAGDAKASATLAVDARSGSVALPPMCAVAIAYEPVAKN